MTYNWGEFGSNCDRFPVRTSRTRVDYRSGSKFFDDVGCPSVEKIVKFSEDIVIIATDDGAIRYADLSVSFYAFVINIITVGVTAKLLRVLIMR